MEYQPLLDERQVAEILNCTVRALQSWRLSGIGPELGRMVRYRPEVVHAYIEANARQSTWQAPDER